MININSKITNKIVAIICLTFLFGWFVYNHFGGDHLQVNNGWGWDGVNYAEWTQTNPFVLAQKKLLSSFLVQRIFPSTVIHFSSKLLHYDLSSPAAVISAFYLYHCLLLIISAFFLWLLAKHLQWSGSILLIAFASLFLNQAILKISTWAPICTDITAFALSLITLYFYFKNRLIPLILLSFCASFVYPTMLYTALPLIMFSIKKPSGGLKPSPSLVLKKVDIILAVLGSVLLTSYAIYLAITGDMRLPEYAPSAIVPINKHLILISIACLWLYLFFAFRYIVDCALVLNTLKKYKIISYRVLIALGLLLIVQFLIMKFSHITYEPGLTPHAFLLKSLLLAIVAPVKNLVTHTMYFGPAILLIIIFWKDFANLTKEKGLGLSLVVFFYLVVGLNSESREIINAWPVFVVLLCETLKNKKLSHYFCYFFTIACIIISRFYLGFDLGRWSAFAAFGPWMNNTIYLLYLVMNILLGLVFYIWLRAPHVLLIRFNKALKS